MVKRLVLAAGLALALAACEDQRTVSSNRHLQPIPPQTVALMSQKGVTPSDPILVRIFKKEAELEVWKQNNDGQYALLKTYPICRWSGQLGPKVREGDRQAPEGFYTVTPALMNPNSSYYLSFNMGFPNQFDRAHGRTGSHLMVHGSCSSRGCYAMTDEAIAEVYAMAREAFAGGQRGFQVQAYPFRMTAENLAKARYDQNIGFWKNLKEGYDHFELTRAEPAVEVCGRQYAFNTRNCAPASPELSQAVATKQAQDEIKIAEYIARGTPAVRFVYEDGGGHPSFREYAMAVATAENPNTLSRAARRLGDVSRPDALYAGLREIRVDSSGRPVEELPAASTPLAFASAASAIQPAAPAQPVAAAVAAPAATAGVSEVAKSEAGGTRPFYRRIFGDLFSSKPLGGAPAVNPAAAAPEAVPQPPPRGAARDTSDRRAGIIPGAHPIIPEESIGYTSLR